MKQKDYMVALTLLLFIGVAGCWNNMELPDLAIVMALGIDQTDDGYRMSIQVLDPIEIDPLREGGGQDTSVTVYQAEGVTIQEAIRKLHTKVPRRVNVSHTQVIVIGETLAKEGVRDTLDLFVRDHEFPPYMLMAISRGIEAQDVVSVLTPIETIPADQLRASLETNAEVWGTTIVVNINDLVDHVNSNDQEAVVSGIQVLGDAKKGEVTENLESSKAFTSLNYDGLAVFKDDRLEGWLNEEESQGYNYAQGNITSTVINVPCGEEGHISLEQLRMNEDSTSNIKNEHPHIEVNISLQANISDVECGMDITKPASVSRLEAAAEGVVEKKMAAAIEKAQTGVQADIFGFGHVIYREHPDVWKQIEDDWDNHFVDLPVNLNVDVQLLQTGEIDDLYEEE
ncbi:Ger(x)C family spore germination protein [Salicibibacter cibarius]|uniref:Ger(X)C family spore germination protein n=1 Tax=Salicibibacter cibarius TaxID=2743000 RepID=A0A7T7CAT1_9BACI|nr:Ger(x)C family spore germination protein [Salicibibacter cibarius]QQK75227.1 Ger(x)C family spore germination protein [Salicibibacter cibarius]